MTPPDDDGRRVELVLAWRRGEWVWSARIDSWDDVAAAAWHPLDSLRALAAVGDDTATVAATDDVVVTGRGYHCDVTVTAADGRSATARDVTRGLADSARTLLDRAEDERSRAGWWSC